MRFVRLNEAAAIFLQLDIGINNQYPQATIIDATGAIAGTVSLVNVPAEDGKYLGDFTFTTLGDYSIKFAVYADAGHTTLNPRYKFGDETVRVTNFEENVEKIAAGEFGNPFADFN